MKPLILLGLCALGLFSRLAADDAPARAGLLGFNYVNANCAWYDFADAPVDGSGFNLEANWSVRSNLDLTLDFETFETDSFLGVSGRQNTFLAGVRVFNSDQKSRYYLEAMAGTAQARISGLASLSDDVLVYRLGVGVEFALNQSLSLTPFLHAEFYDSDADSAVVYGLKANTWLSRHWALSAALMRNDDGDLRYQFGVTARF